MEKFKGLTGCREECQVLIGTNPGRGFTGSGREYFICEAAFGGDEPSSYKFATWRHVVAYGQHAEALHDAVKGSLIQIRGWIETEGKKDKSGKVITENGRIVKQETLIVEYAELLQRERNIGHQSSFEEIQDSQVDEALQKILKSEGDHHA